MKVTEGAARHQGEISAGQAPYTARSADDHASAGWSRTPRAVWIALIMLTAVIVGGVAGLLAHADGTSVPGAILTGGGSFAGTVVLLLAIAHFVNGYRH